MGFLAKPGMMPKATKSLSSFLLAYFTLPLRPFSRTCLAGAFLPPELASVPKVQSPVSSTLQLPLPVLSMKFALQKSLWQQNGSYSLKHMEKTS